MINRFTVRAAGLATLLAMPAGSLTAQGTASGSVSGSAPDNTSAPVALPAEAPKKKGGGLFGKVKSVAGNKVVKAVAKAAACTMVPGGQFVAGAIDGASAQDMATGAAGDAAAKPAGGAAAGAATNVARGAAAGAAVGAVAGAGLSAGGNPCIPGMGMMANPAASMSNSAASTAGALPGAGLPGMPNGMSGVELSEAQIQQMAEQYRKAGIPPAQIQAMQQQMRALMQMNTGSAGLEPVTPTANGKE